ncbi:MAG: inositol monophosphatase [Thiobacillus sp. SCN 63-374]|nr:MAG: inositol monophosphatase [Thiobacillus sp. SCN 63-374]
MLLPAHLIVLDQVQALVRQVAQCEVTPRFLKVAHSHKQDGSLFTEADAATQAALEAALPHIKDVPVLGEEMTERQQRDAWEAGRDGLWCVDPIDGTSNFVAGVPYFAVSVATELRRALAGVEMKRIDRELAGRLAAWPPYASQRNFGASTLDWCYTAAGRFDIYVHGGQKLWDYAAGALILEEAGGRLASLSGSFELFELWRAWLKAAGA